MPNNKHITTGEAPINGTYFAYEITGTGHSLVLVHAGIADQRMWDEQVAAFAKHYQVIRYDMRSFGKTPMVAEQPYTHSRDLHALLAYLGIERAFILGCSMGSATAIDFTLEHPEMVDALIAVTSNISGFEFSDDELPELYQEHVAALERGDITRASEAEAQYWLCGPQRMLEQVDAHILERLSAMNVIALTNKTSEQENEQQLEPPAFGRLSEISMPTLVIIGDLDDANIVKCGGFLATNIPKAKRVVMQGTAHLPSMERPDEFNQIVLDFLASI